MTETHTQLEPTFSIVAQGIRDLSFENQIGFGTNISEQPEINIIAQLFFPHYDEFLKD